MKEHERESRIDALLSGGRLAGPARERIFRNVMAGTQTRRASWQPWLFRAGGLAVAAAALFLLVPQSGFRPRGRSGAILEVGCRDGATTACPLGSTLLFRVSGADHAGGSYLSAWAEPVAPVGGERVWYFPGSDGISARVAAVAATQTLAEGVRAGPMAARYVVHLRLTATPLARAELLALPPTSALAAADVPLNVTP